MASNVHGIKTPVRKLPKSEIAVYHAICQSGLIRKMPRVVRAIHDDLKIAYLIRMS